MLNSKKIFWILLALCTIAYFWRVYQEIQSEPFLIKNTYGEINLQGTSDTVPSGKEVEKVLGEPSKAEIVADIIHEEKKVDKVVIRVWLQGSMKPVNPLKWKTTDERAKEFLDRVGLGHTLPTWKTLWDTYKLDYTLPLCIAWADSHLWKANKSTNNIGNVWNNDRWDVVHYATLDKGIEAIFFTLRDYHTERNRAWMKDSAIIWQLSWEWRKRLWLPWCVETKWFTKCYATSMWVWSTNVTNCLSVIKNTKIDENYEFRR